MIFASVCPSSFATACPSSVSMRPATSTSSSKASLFPNDTTESLPRKICCASFAPTPHRAPISIVVCTAEAGIPLNFHIFSGNCALGGGFANLTDVSSKRFAKAKRIAAQADEDGSEEQLTTVLGLAVGMSPIVELTGGGVLERYPDLRMVVTESECGWLAWLLQAMDQIQERRFHNMRKLELRASEYFLRQGTVTISDDAVALNNVTLTGTECLMWGNDYPHDEGTFPFSRRPIEEIKSKLDGDAARHVLGGNAARLFGFDLAYLAANQQPVRASEAHPA